MNQTELRELIAHGEHSIPRHEVEIILAHILGVSRKDLHTRVVPEELYPENIEAILNDLVERRIAGEPLQYITGEAGFRYIDLIVGPGVLVPRPETEMIVDIAIAEMKKRLQSNPDQQLSLIDLGAGSGAICLAIENEVASHFSIGIIAVEKSHEAVEYLKKNCEKYGSQIRILHESAESALPQVKCDIVVANPPYIPEQLLDDGSLPGDLTHEPISALSGGAGDGMEIPQLFIDAAARLLKPGGFFICERFEEQAGAFEKLLDQNFESITQVTDLAGRSRFTSAYRK
jgi:release factor glutamine methyltransferase